MRRIIVAGNWKMNKDHHEGGELAREILEGLEERERRCEVVLIPPFTTLPVVTEVVEGSDIKVGAQDIFYEDEGAYTGEISGRMLKSLGCTYALVGHSERRHIMGESDDTLAGKLRATLRSNLVPIFCVGELLEEREAGKAHHVVIRQIREVLNGLEEHEISRVVIAYEPVWAIGTGKTATVGDASEMHRIIRGIVVETFSEMVGESTSILYGGSVKPNNAAELLSDPEIDGVLVGGASLEASSFLGIIAST